MGLSLLAQVGIAIGLFVAEKLLSKPPKAKPQDWTSPTSEEGKSIPVHWGVAEMAPNTVWVGEIQKKKEGSIFRYYASMHHVFCFGLVNEVVDYSFDGKSCRNHHLTHMFYEVTGPTPSDPVMVGSLNPVVMALDPLLPIEIDLQGDQRRKNNNSPAMFGGNQAGGGIAGNVAFYFGSDSQTVDPLLEDAIAYGASRVSRWPRIAYARMGGPAPGQGFYQGTSTTAYQFRAVLRRTHWWEGATSPLGQTNAQCNMGSSFGHDANPVEILYDILTSQVYGMGRPASRLDVPSFEDAAVTLRDEFITPLVQGFGLSVVVDGPKEAGSVIREILDHIDGSFAMNPITGKWRLKLIRNDYDPDLIPVIDETIARDLVYAPTTWANTINQVRVTYKRFVNTTERRGFVEAVASAMDEANFQATGSLRTLSIDMPYITDADVAQFVAERERRLRGVPLAKVSWSMDRSGYTLMQGDVVKLNASAFGLAGLIVRILSVNYGTLEDGRILIEGVQDVFSVTSAVYDAPGESGFAEQEVEVPAPVDDELNVIWGENRP